MMAFLAGLKADCIVDLGDLLKLVDEGVKHDHRLTISKVMAINAPHSGQET